MCKDILRSDLKNALLLHTNFNRPWHYGLDLSDKDNLSSLSTYLKLIKDQYKDLLQISGLATKQLIDGVTRCEINCNEWKKFLVSIGMDT